MPSTPASGCNQPQARKPNLSESETTQTIDFFLSIIYGLHTANKCHEMISIDVDVDIVFKVQIMYQINIKDETVKIPALNQWPI